MIARQVAMFLLVVVALAGCQCGPEPCRTKPRGEGLEEEVCIPGGVFRMGHAKLPKPPAEKLFPGVLMPQNDWWPEHEVKLSPYFIDKYEVTWGRYRQCVEAGVCKLDGIRQYQTMYGTLDAFNDLARQSQPAWSLYWKEALEYCLWAGKRLPTEAEWERAARGGRDYDFPWGNEPVTPEQNRLSDDEDVGAIEGDVTVEGVIGMFGGTSEWVSDWYDPYYYQRSPRENPQGPEGPVYVTVEHEYDWGFSYGANGEHIVRGEFRSHVGDETWDGIAKGSAAWMRDGRPSTEGARCARDDRPFATPPPSGAWPYRNVQWRPIPGGGR